MFHYLELSVIPLVVMYAILQNMYPVKCCILVFLLSCEVSICFYLRLKAIEPVIIHCIHDGCPTCHSHFLLSLPICFDGGESLSCYGLRFLTVQLV